VNPLTGEILSSFSNPGKRVDGMAFDGGTLWLSDASILTIYQITLQGGLLKTFLSPGQAPRGLAFDGVYLWNADANQKIYQLRVNN
jgi:sugar lactone lactonase YvrE